MMKKAVLAFTAMLFGSLLFASTARACHFEPVDTTGVFTTILIMDVSIDGLSLQPGDEVGVFDGPLCVGTAVYDGSDTLVIGAIMEVVLPPPGNTLPGAVVGNPIEFRIWQKHSELELVGTPIFGQGGNFGDPITVVEQLAANTTGLPPLISKNHPISAILFSNYPNPFNPYTTIRFFLPNTSKVRISIFDIRGRTVRILVDTIIHNGNQEFVWDGCDNFGNRLSSGSYIVRLETHQFTQDLKVTLVN